MENKLIQNNIDLDVKYHPEIKGLQIINGKNNFPISWLNKQGYCEYSLYLEHFEGISTAPTQAMLTGSKEHEKLEDKFKETATPSTFDDACELSREKEILSREMYVVDVENGIRGYIDEIWMTPTQIVIIERGTDNIFWSEEFDEKNEKRILFLLDRMQGLFEGTKPFIPTKNPNKCRKCRYQSYCEHKAV